LVVLKNISTEKIIGESIIHQKDNPDFVGGALLSNREIVSSFFVSVKSLLGWRWFGLYW